MAQNIRAQQLQEEESTKDPSTPTNSSTPLDLANVGELKLELPHGYPAVEVINYAPPHPEARGRPKGKTPRDHYHINYYRQSKSLPSSAATSPTRESTKFFHESYHDRGTSVITYHNRPTSLTPDLDVHNRSKVTETLKPPAPVKVVVPVVLSKAPPHPKTKERARSSVSSLASEVDMSGNAGALTVTVKFEVCVSDVLEGEEVRITGSVTALGSWNIKSSVPLKKHQELQDTWYIELGIPADVTVKYRYLVVKKLPLPNGGTAIDICRRETTLHPRQCCVRNQFDEPDGPDSPEAECSDGPVTLKGSFGENEVGEKAQDDGWLVGASEIHLQLFPTTDGGPIKIASLADKTCYSVRVEPMVYNSQPDAIPLKYPPLKVKLLDREKGDCEFRDQDDYGCSFHQDTQMMIFHTRATSFKTLGFTVDVYHSKEDASSKCDDVAGTKESMVHVGRTSILPAQYLSGSSKGQLTLTLFSPQLISIGTITFSYLLIHPVTDSQSLHFTKYSYSNYWKEHKRPLDIGHRGSGDSYHVEAELKPTVTENTILSLKQAGLHGADYVEFDVQLTKDLIPVVYHNFRVCTTLARQGYFSGELYEMFVKDLTLSQLQQLKLDHSSVLSQRKGGDFVDGGGGGRRSGYNSSGSGGENSYDSDSSMETYWGVGSYKEVLPERKTFPTLKQIFKSIPSHVGFNIEIKYPNPRQDVPATQFDYFDRNMMADIILKTVYRHAHRRKIIFSCFDSDMCTILRLKQPKYPVVFLTTNLYHLWGTPCDVREATIYDAMMHARAEKLLGIDVHSTYLLANPDLMDAIKRRELVVFTWGQDNNKVENIEKQKKMGVDAVIFDCLSTLIPRQKNVFQIEEEEERKKLQRYWQERKERMEKRMHIQTLKNMAATMPKLPTKSES